MSNVSKSFFIDKTRVGKDCPTYFIADIAANHDGSLDRAKDLIWKAAESGANAAKFQHFQAETIVSDFGFQDLGKQASHQSSWKKSVFDVYKEASLNVDWTDDLKKTCDEAGITFFTSPYSKELIDYVDDYVPAYKVGSGDITWHDIIDYMAEKGKPMLLAAGASTLTDVQQAMDVVLKKQSNVVLMQCNTNYTASIENYKYINLNVLNAFKDLYPEVVLGLSDHTPGHTTVLGAVALGARVVEKHFTDDCDRDGPDHKFSMDPDSWSEMVVRTRELESALGDGQKRVEDNEAETVVLQRRALRATKDLSAGNIIEEGDLFPLRPCPAGAIQPYELSLLLGKELITNIAEGDTIRWEDLTSV